ncbi:MFS transporter [Weissella minor]|uniref:MFS transporter n=1 Tax=Weissella minor TaxID=1620 RepID=UPI003AF21CDC
MAIVKKYYIVSGIYNIGVAFFGGTLYLLMQQHGFSAADINLFLIVFWIVSFIFEMPSGIFADTFGPRRSVVLSSLLRILGLGILLVPSSALTILIVAAILTAISDTLKSSTLEAWVSNELHSKNLDNFFANSSKLNTVINLLGGFFGAQILGKVNYAYPVLGSIVCFILAMVVGIMLLPKATRVKGDERRVLGMDLHEFKHTITQGQHELKVNQNFRLILLSFIPSMILVTVPFNQWQLYFDQPQFGHQYLIGWILLGINLAALFGARCAQFVMRVFGKRYQTIAAILVINFIFIILSALMGNVYIAIGAFLLHTMMTSLEEVLRATMLNEQLSNQSRTMMLSVFNTIESMVTIIVLAVDALLIKFMPIQLGWIILGNIALVLAIPVFYRIKKRTTLF